MLHDGSVVVDIHVRERMGTTVGAKQQRVAGRVVAGVVGIGRGTHQSAVGVLRMAGRDTLGDDSRLRVLTHVNHLRTGISLLIVVGHGHAIELCL